MPQTIRFHLDEHINPAIAAGLRRRGIDVTTTYEAGLSQASDDEHLDYGVATNRVTLTTDHDFLLIAYGRFDHVGIIFCEQTKLTIGYAVKRLQNIWLNHDSDDMQGQVQFI